MPTFSRSRAHAKAEKGDGKPAGIVKVPAAFFSYSREDSEFVLRVAKDLKAAQANVWLDQIDIVPGQRWDDAIERALADCPRMLVVLSPAAVHSTNVMDEVSFALEEGKTVVPILYRDCGIPFRLRRVQYIDFRHDYEHGLTELLKTLAARRQDTERPTLEASSHQDDHGGIREAENMGEPAESAHPLQATGSPAVAASDVAPGPGASPMAEAGLSGQRSGPAEPLFHEAGPLQRESGGGSAGSWRLSVKTKVAAGACAAAIAVVILVRGLHPSPPKPYLTNAGGVQTLPTNSVASIGTVSGAPGPGNSAAKVTSATKDEATNAAPAVQPKSSPTEDAVPKQAVTGKPAKPPADGAKPSNSHASRGLSTTDPAVANLYQRAEAGDTHAMVEIGMHYVYGRGVPKDFQEAVNWLRKSANAGDAAGMNNLGVMYANGYGVPKDYDQAASWYRKAANAGYAPAMANLGSMYEKGNGVAKDSHQAVGWYQRAAQAGSISAMYDLGAMYESGEGVGKDRQQAVVWYRKAAVLGEPHAKDSLNRMGAMP